MHRLRESSRAALKSSPPPHKKCPDVNSTEHNSPGAMTFCPCLFLGIATELKAAGCACRPRSLLQPSREDSLLRAMRQLTPAHLPTNAEDADLGAYRQQHLPGFTFHKPTPLLSDPRVRRTTSVNQHAAHDQGFSAQKEQRPTRPPRSVRNSRLLGTAPSATDMGPAGQQTEPRAEVSRAEPNCESVSRAEANR